MAKREEDPRRFELPVGATAPEKLPAEAPITDVEPLKYISCLRFRRNEIERYVEQPLVEACRILFDKNVPTTLTSANEDDILRGSDAALFIDYDALTKENRRIARKVGDIHQGQGVRTCVIRIPMSGRSTIASVSEHAVAIAERFEPQEAPVWPD